MGYKIHDFEYDLEILDNMFIYKVLSVFHSGHFEPNMKSLRQFWFFHIVDPLGGRGG